MTISLQASISLSTAPPLTQSVHGVESKGLSTTRLSFAICNNDLTRFAIKTLSPENEALTPSSIRLGWIERWFWTPITIRTERGQKTVLININSAIKRLHLLGFSKTEVKRALKENNLDSLLLQNKLYKIEEILPLDATMREDFNQALRFIEQNRDVWNHNMQNVSESYPRSQLDVLYSATTRTITLKIKGLDVDYDSLNVDYLIHRSLHSYSPSLGVSKYLKTHTYLLFANRAQYLKKGDTGLARSLFINEEGRVFLLLNRKQLDGKLGSGGFKKVSFAIDLTTAERIASASLRINTTTKKEDIQKEIDAHRRLAHIPLILKSIGDVSYYSPKSGCGKIRLFTTYCNGGELCKRIELNSLTINQKKRIFEDLIACVAAVHEAGLIHRDIKPENVFLHEDENGNMHAILGDLAFVTHEEDSARLLADFGTVGFFPLDYLSTFSTKLRPITYADDVWALGLTLYELLRNKAISLEFKGSVNDWYKNLAEDIRGQLSSIFHRPFNGRIKNPMDIIHLMLKEDARERITAKEALSHLEHLEWNTLS